MKYKTCHELTKLKIFGTYLKVLLHYDKVWIVEAELINPSP